MGQLSILYETHVIGQLSSLYETHVMGQLSSLYETHVMGQLSISYETNIVEFFQQEDLSMRSKRPLRESCPLLCN